MGHMMFPWETDSDMLVSASLRQSYNSISKSASDKEHSESKA